MVRFKFLVLLTWLVIGQWEVECENEPKIDWSLYQRLQTLQIGLVQNKNLNKYVSSSDYSVSDTRFERSYNTEKCIKDLQTIQKAFNDDSSDWANEMLGAWGKLPSVGFEKDFGNFDLCYDLEVDASINIETQYCVASIYAWRSNVNKILPADSKLGICIPNSCAPSLIATILNDYLDPKGTIGFDISADDCRFKDDHSTLSSTHKVLISCATAILGLVILCSIYDVLSTVPDDEKNPVLLAFSVCTNAKNLFACRSNQSPNVITCLDGIRVISAFCIVADHFEWINKHLVTNAGDTLDQMSRIFNAAPFGVDTFFVMSAFLAANKMLHELSTKGLLNIPLLYIQRVLRISPVLTVVLLFYVYFIHFCTNGPMDTAIVHLVRGGCGNSSWPTFLYYNNYFVTECVPGSWFLATDMQLYLLTPFLVILLQRFPKLFMSFSLAMAVFDLFNSKADGVEGTYLLVRARIVPWLIGVILAYILFQIRSKKQFQIPKHLNLLLLTVSLGVLTKLTYTASTFDGLLNFLWQGRIPWSLSISYIIFACVNGQADIINRFLSHPLWQPLSRLSFNIYIIHIGLIEIMYANRKIAWYYSAFTQVQDYFSVLAIACAIAILLALTIEMPITNLSHHYFSRKKGDAITTRMQYCPRFKTILGSVVSEI